MNKNGTPYTDEQWKRWYSITSSSDMTLEEIEAHADVTNIEIDQILEDRHHNHMTYRR